MKHDIRIQKDSNEEIKYTDRMECTSKIGYDKRKREQINREQVIKWKWNYGKHILSSCIKYN